MSNTRTFTNSEIGAYLTAVGSVMHNHDLCAGAATDGESEGALLSSLAEQGIEDDVAKELIALDLQFCIDYMAPLPERN